MSQSDNRRRSVLVAARRAMLFSVGSALIIQEKLAEFVEQAIERGQEAQQEGKKLVQERRAQRQHNKPTHTDVVKVRVNNALKRLDVPLQQDLAELEQHIQQLDQNIDELRSAC